MTDGTINSGSWLGYKETIFLRETEDCLRS
nr:MAG TPA: hypothetical protein [Caudoviricetes sp.]